MKYAVVLDKLEGLYVYSAFFLSIELSGECSMMSGIGERGSGFRRDPVWGDTTREACKLVANLPSDTPRPLSM